MLAILFLVLCAMFGYELVSFFVPDVRRLFVASAANKNTLSNVADWLFRIPAALISGITIVTFLSYILCSAFGMVLDRNQSCETVGLFMTTAIILYFTVLLYSKRRKKADLENPSSGKIADFDNSFLNIIFYGICMVLFTAIATFLFTWSFRLVGTELREGYSVFSDLAPHTAMVSSFGKGSNFPTQYMHFSGDGIQYHFLFYFFCGVLQYLGMPIDYAINIPSIIGAVCCFMLLGLIAVLLSGKRMTYIIAPVLVLLRSGMNIFMSLQNMHTSGISYPDAFKLLMNSVSWFDQTPYDNWGVWAINVYANQRHLLFGISLILIIVLLYIPHVRRLCINLMNSKNFGKALLTFFFGKYTWGMREKDSLHPVKSLIFTCLLLICMPYFHGSCLIALLLVLFGMAIFSENKLSYLIAAISAVASSFIQTYLFSGGASNVVSMFFNPGFVAESKTVNGIASYLFKSTGLTLILAAVFFLVWLTKDIIFNKPVYRNLLMVAFSFPLVFAFTVQVTTEMLANHKFVQITLILLDIFVAALLSNLFMIPFTMKKKTVKLPELLPLPDETSAMVSEAASEETASENKALPEPAKESADDNTKKKNTDFGLPWPIFVPLQVVSAVLALALFIGLIGTGIGEWAVYYNLNKRYLSVDTSSDLVEWLEENTEKDDVFLTPVWYTNRFFLAGRATYYGWPYYAWSAGHDTDTRLIIYEWLISGCQNDIDEFRRYCKERNIKYLVLDPEFYDYTNASGEYIFNGEFLSENLTQVAYFPNDNNTIIYQIY